MTTVDDDQTMRSNEELIGRENINDLEAVLNFVGQYDVEGYHRVPDNCPAEFTWDYEKGAKPQLDKLYEKAKKAQWNASTDLDWSIEVDQERVVVANAEANPGHAMGRVGRHRHAAREVGREALDRVRDPEPELDCCPSSSTASRAPCCARRRSWRPCRGSTPSTTRPPR